DHLRDLCLREPERVRIAVDRRHPQPELLRPSDGTPLVAPGADEEDRGHVTPRCYSGAVNDLAVGGDGVDLVREDDVPAGLAVAVLAAADHVALAVTGVDHVAASLAVDPVVARTARQHVARRPAGEVVVYGAAAEGVLPEPADEDVVAGRR